MDLHPSGKTAVVTGASKGIGLAITKALVEAGAHVVAGSRSKGSDLAELEDTGQVSFVPVDLAQPDACGELVGAAAHRGGIDVLVNNVGAVGIRPGGFASITDDEWQASWNLNAKALSRNWGRRTFASIPSAGPVSTGLWMDEGGVADGFTTATGQTADQIMAAITTSTPTGRFTTPQQVAELVVFLASDRSANTTGSDFASTGGSSPRSEVTGRRHARRRIVGRKRQRDRGKVSAGTASAYVRGGADGKTVTAHRARCARRQRL